MLFLARLTLLARDKAEQWELEPRSNRLCWLVCGAATKNDVGLKGMRLFLVNCGFDKPQLATMVIHGKWRVGQFGRVGPLKLNKKNIQDCTEGGTCPCDPSPNLNKNPVATTKKFTHYWLKSWLLRMTKEQPLKTNKNMRSCKDTLQSSILFAVQKISLNMNRSNNEICGSVMGNLLAALVWFSACAWLRSSKLRWPWGRTKHPWHRPTLCQFLVCFGLLLSQVLGCADMEVGKSPWFVGRLVTLCSLRPLKKIALTVPETRTILVISRVTHGGHIVTTGRPNGDAFFNPGQVVIVTGDCHQANNLCTLHSPLFQHVELAKARCRQLEKVLLKRLEPKEATSTLNLLCRPKFSSKA